MNPIVSAQWLHDNFNDPDLIILDASPATNKSGLKTNFSDIRIKSARFFDLKNSFSDKESDLPGMLPSPEAFTLECQKLRINKNSKIVVYDNLGIYTSPRVWWMFRSMGHNNVAVLDGGLPTWINENMDCEPIKEDNQYPQGNFTATHHQNLIQNAQGVLENLSSEAAIVVDARSEGRFTGRVAEPREGLASGHIPNSFNLPFERVLKDGKFLPPDELKKVFGKLGLTNESLIFTCGSGITAAILFLASELVLENAKSVYDGSWSEWGQMEGYPVV